MYQLTLPSLRQGAVIPHVTVIRENIIYKSQLVVLDILRDRIEFLLLVYLHFGVCPARYLDDGIVDVLFLVGHERNVMKRTDKVITILIIDSIAQRVQLASHYATYIAGHFYFLFLAFAF
jgi:hypothetical protein